MSKAILLLFLLAGSTTYTQIRQIKMSVYFDTDKYNLRKDARLTLDKLADSIKGLDVTKIIARGNTDNRADSLYNVTLSQNRTAAVSKYLTGKGLAEKLFTQEHFGENKPIAANADEKGMQNNRRVDVIVYYKVKKAPELPKEVVKAPEPVKPVEKQVVVKAPDPCAKDTVILLSNRTQVQMSMCLYQKRRDCLDIQSALTPDEAAAMNLTTRTTNGTPLASGGMISIVPKAGCDGGCFDPPMKVRLPIRDRGCMPAAPGMYDMETNGRWKRTKEKLGIVTIDGVSYYEFEVRCPGKKNVDVPSPTVGKTKVKAPRGKGILETTFSQDCPFERYVYEGQKQKNGRYKRRLKVIDLPCDMGGGDIYSLVVDKKTGDTLEIKIKPVQNLRKRLFYPCKSCNKRRILWVFNVRRHIKPMLHRKYVYKKRRDPAVATQDSIVVQNSIGLTNFAPCFPAMSSNDIADISSSMVSAAKNSYCCVRPKSW